MANITSNFDKLEAADIAATSAILRQITATASTDEEVCSNPVYTLIKWTKIKHGNKLKYDYVLSTN